MYHVCLCLHPGEVVIFLLAVGHILCSLLKLCDVGMVDMSTIACSYTALGYGSFLCKNNDYICLDI